MEHTNAIQEQSEENGNLGALSQTFPQAWNCFKNKYTHKTICLISYNPLSNYGEINEWYLLVGFICQNYQIE